MVRTGDGKGSRREEILAAARAVFAEKGLAGATMHEIAARARCSKETLYAWFDDKTTLFETLFRERLQTVGSTLAQEAPGGEPERVLYIIARDVLRFINAADNMALFDVAGDAAKRDPALRALLARSVDRSDFGRFFERCRAQGVMAFDADPQEMASMFIMMAQSEWPRRISYGMVPRMTEAQIDAQAKLATDMFLKAVAP